MHQSKIAHGCRPNSVTAPTTSSSGAKPQGFNFSRERLKDDYVETDKGKRLKVRHETPKKATKRTKPGTWESELHGGSYPLTLYSTDTRSDRKVTVKKEDSGLPSPPLVSRIESGLAKSFDVGQPLTDKPDIVKCNHCKRAILRHRAKAHVEDCIAKKQEKQRKKKEAKDARDAAARKAERGGESSSEDESIDGSITARKTDGGDGSTAGKKRKAEDMGEAGPKKKKKKDEPKTKAPRPKAPVDVEKQCGVELPQGGQCARSLTCKSHSMGAKRAVPGRSAPYDKLLAEYQRKNQAKLQKAALESQPLLPDDELAPQGPIDSDEEKDLVLAALARSKPKALYEPQFVPLKRKYQYVRLQEMLGNVLGGRGGGGLFGMSQA